MALITNVSVLTRRSLIVTLTIEPPHVDAGADGDALNPASWTLTRTSDSHDVPISSVDAYSLPYTFRLNLGEGIAPGAEHTLTGSFVEVDVSGSLAGLSWKLPCLGGHSGAVCPSGSDHSETTLAGITGRTYNVTLRFQGVIERKQYSGGTNDGAFFQTGGSPVGTGWNTYKLTVSDPAQTYYLNRGALVANEVVAIDYQATIQIAAGALVELDADSGGDAQEIWNGASGVGPLTAPDATIVSQPYDGQFIQMDVVSVGDTDTSFASTTFTTPPVCDPITEGIPVDRNRKMKVFPADTNDDVLAQMPGYTRKGSSRLRAAVIAGWRCMWAKAWLAYGRGLGYAATPRYAEGAWLDVWGVILKRDRQDGEEDGPYRDRLLAHPDVISPNVILTLLRERVRAITAGKYTAYEPAIDGRFYTDGTSDWYAVYQPSAQRLLGIDPDGTERTRMGSMYRNFTAGFHAVLPNELTDLQANQIISEIESRRAGGVSWALTLDPYIKDAI